VFLCTLHGSAHQAGCERLKIIPTFRLLATYFACLPAYLLFCVQVDTLVMQNLGYFQLKASPGLWQLSIAPGGHKSLSMSTCQPSRMRDAVVQHR
jgi:hypothetical protein